MNYATEKRELERSLARNDKLIDASNVHFRRGLIEVGLDDISKFQAAATDARLVEMGLKSEKDARAGFREFMGMADLEIGKRLLVAKLVDPPPTKDALAVRLLADDDMNAINADVFKNALQNGWNQNFENHTLWTDSMELPDFKTATIANFEAETPETLGTDGAEIPLGKLVDAGESVTLRTEAKMHEISKKVYTTNTLRNTARGFQAIGQSMRRREADLCYSVLTTNGSMADGQALFSTAHSNIETTGAAPSATTVNAAISAMRSQKLLTDSTLPANITPRFLIAPTGMGASVETLLKQMRDDFTLNPLRAIFDARLDIASSAGWYLAAPGGVTRFYLEGQFEPQLDWRFYFYTDSLQIKIRHDFAAAAVDPRRLFYNDGA